MVNNLIEDDLKATLIHEILHGIYPDSDDDSIRKTEDDICSKYEIQREYVLEKLT